MARREHPVTGMPTLDERVTMEALSAKFPAYRIIYADVWQAFRRDGTGDVLRGLTLDDLAAAIRACVAGCSR